MNTLLIILVALSVIILGLGLILIQRLRRNHALRLLQLTSQKASDAAAATALNQLSQQDLLPALTAPLVSQVAADIWGRGVLVFEYQVTAGKLTAAQLTMLTHQLEQALVQAAKQQGLTAFKPDIPVFTVSDIWLLTGNLHFDIAYMRNQATFDYVADMRKLSVEKGTN
ncbi:hypothetical protein [Loigolactobacillus jiayinensis]|uniref:Uncharacterized protein n=1 Tax=Loigolactobacillus jiayinensis TaxID=2486016 RepID=A0ABW1RCY7_9LACO|nr:hypothetical protein [Loigolactobacillus jiayinensis]